jgi:HK97 family phage major capsid protein
MLDTELQEVLEQVKTLGLDFKAALQKEKGDRTTAQAEMSAQFAEIEQKLARRTNKGGGPELKTLGQLVVDDEQTKSYLAGPRRGNLHLSYEAKNITSGSSTVGSTVSTTTSLVTAQRAPIVMLPDRRLTIRDLLAPGETDTGIIEYAVETAFTNNAATVAEGALKPQSDITFDLRSSPARTIAHVMKASRQILDDAPQLQSVIDGRLRYGLNFVEEAQFLYGDGAAQNLFGIVPQATAFSAAFAVTGETAIDRISLAMLQATLALYPPTGIVLNPTDWTKISMTKDSMGRYIIGDPQGTVTPQLWGLPVVATPAITAGTFLVGSFRLAAQIFDRLTTEVLISTEDQDNFVKNMVTIRGEERVALAVYRPAAFVTGSLP